MPKSTGKKSTSSASKSRKTTRVASASKSPKAKTVSVKSKDKEKTVSKPKKTNLKTKSTAANKTKTTNTLAKTKTNTASTKTKITPSKSASKPQKNTKETSPKELKVTDINSAFTKFVKDNHLAFSSTSDKGKAFEKFCVPLLKAEGYSMIKEETRHSGDKGIDLVVSRTRTVSSDNIFFDDEKVKTVFAVQCKYKSSGKIGSPIVRNLKGSVDDLKHYKNKKAILMTNVEYTYDASELESQQIKLYDGNNLYKVYLKAKKKGLF